MSISYAVFCLKKKTTILTTSTVTQKITRTQSPLAAPSALSPCSAYLVFFFNDTATTEIYTLSLHDALPIAVGLSSSSNRYCLHDFPGSRRPQRAPIAPWPFSSVSRLGARVPRPWHVMQPPAPL